MTWLSAIAATTAGATFAVELHARRAKRGHAQIAVKAWTAAHPWHLTMAKAPGGATAKPAAPLALEEVVAGRDAQVQHLKRYVTEAQARVIMEATFSAALLQ